MKMEVKEMHRKILDLKFRDFAEYSVEYNKEISFLSMLNINYEEHINGFIRGNCIEYIRSKPIDIKIDCDSKIIQGVEKEQDCTQNQTLLSQIKETVLKQGSKKIENLIINGKDKDNEPVGILSEKEIQYTDNKVKNIFECIVNSENQVRLADATPGLIALHPNEYSQLKKQRQIDFNLQFSKDITKPTIQGTCVVQSDCIRPKTFLILDLRSVIIVCKENVEVFSDESKNQLLIKSYFNQFTQNPKGVCRFEERKSLNTGLFNYES